MKFFDLVLMGLIIAGAIYILYRSLFKKKGHCGGCSVGTCETDNQAKTPKFPDLK